MSGQNLQHIRKMGDDLKPWQTLPCGLTASEFCYLYFHHVSERRNVNRDQKRTNTYSHSLTLSQILSEQSQVRSFENGVDK